MKIIQFICLLAFSSQLSTSFAQSPSMWTSGRPDGHAPIGVMGDHTHAKGEFMVSYRYMQMEMDGMRAKDESVSPEYVLQDFMITPLSMPMDMQMIGAMYAASDKLTIMAMVNIIATEMEHRTRMGGMFTTTAGGLGDTRIGGLYTFLDKNGQRMHANLSIGIPTGSIEEKDVTPASAPNEMQLPYPMQIGSGSWDVLPGVTYLSQKEKTSFGAQVSGILRLHDNDRDYRLGNQFSATTWAAYKLANVVSASLRARYTTQGEIENADPAYTMMVANNMVPTVVTSNSGYSTLYAGGGVNVFIPKGALKDIRMAVELEIPVYQNVNGVQMETDYQLTAGIQYAF